MNVASAEHRTCAACGGGEASLLFRQSFARMDAGSLLGGYDVVSCTTCGFAFADGIPAQDAFDAYYREFSKYENPGAFGAVAPVDQARFAQTASTLVPHLPPRARVLEFGCASGGLLKELADRAGASVAGIDPSPACADAAGRLYGMPVKVGSIFDGLLAGERFDALVLVGVLEHLSDLSRAFAVLRSHLGAGGLVLIEVPDATRFVEHAAVPFQQFSLEHINFFTPASLARLAAREGFSMREVQQPVRDTGRRGSEPVICAVLRLEETPVPTPPRDEEGPRAIARYVARSEAMEAPARERLSTLARDRRPLVVWGAGTQTLRMLAATELREVPIRAFIDSNVRYHGRTLAGAPIVPPSEVKRFAEPILIGSTGFQDEIASAIRERFGCPNELITLAPLSTEKR